MTSTSKKLLKNNKYNKLNCSKIFPEGSFLESFGAVHEHYSDIDLHKFYTELLKEKIIGIFEEKDFAKQLRTFLKKYNISCRMENVAMRNIALKNNLRIGGHYQIESTKGLQITLYFDRKRFDKVMTIDKTIWKNYCIELVKTLSHELIHVAQYYNNRGEDVYDHITFDKPDGIKKSHYNEMLYVNEAAEIEAFMFEACLQAKLDNCDPLFTNDVFAIMRAAGNFDKYFVDKSYYHTFKQNIEDSISFWQKYLK